MYLSICCYTFWLSQLWWQLLENLYSMTHKFLHNQPHITEHFFNSEVKDSLCMLRMSNKLFTYQSRILYVPPTSFLWNPLIEWLRYKERKPRGKIYVLYRTSPACIKIKFKKTRNVTSVVFIIEELVFRTRNTGQKF
jgi:hypothetical protein